MNASDQYIMEDFYLRMTFKSTYVHWLHWLHGPRVCLSWARTQKTYFFGLKLIS